MMSRKVFNILWTTALAIGLLVMVAGCEKEGPAEKTGEKIDEAVEETKEGAREAKEKAEEAVKDN